MRTHSLEIEKEYLHNLISGGKKAEIRLNDRDYQAGDILEFTDYEVYDHPREVRFRITHIHSGPGMEQNYVVLSLEPVK